MKFSRILILLCFVLYSEAMKNYAGTDLQKCFNCFCHARTGCYRRENCASYSISFDYWKTANSPVVSENDEANEDGWKNCMKNENCIYATLDQYAEAIGHMDCNCDGTFDCKDRFAIHLYGAECTNPQFNRYYVRRFNTCRQEAGVAEMLEKEGFEGCTPEVV